MLKKARATCIEITGQSTRYPLHANACKISEIRNHKRSTLIHNQATSSTKRIDSIARTHRQFKEKVQRRATKTKLVTSLAKLTYEQTLRHPGLHSYCRRQRGDLIETFKILNGLENVEASKFFERGQPGCTRAEDEGIQCQGRQTESQTVD